MKILLIEDDITECNDYRKEILNRNKFVLHVVHGCNAALNKIESTSYDNILLDLELNNGDADGDGIYFLKKLQEKKLKNPPYIIVITVNISTNTHAIARKYGADFIFIKFKIDYSPKLVIDFACLTKGITIEVPTYQNENEIKKHIAKYLENIGITYTLAGMSYLIDAIYMVAKKDTVNLSKDIYPELANIYQKSTYSIQKAIRSAIEKAWRDTDLNVLSDNYTVELNCITSTPSNKELICYYANKLRYHDRIIP